MLDNKIDLTEIEKHFYYKDGDLYNKTTRSSTCIKDAASGTVNKKGYKYVCLNRKVYRAHRLIYAMHYGEIPDGFAIDHKDGNPLNNNIDNLRIATPSQNSRNKKAAMSNNKLGTLGVSLDKWNKTNPYRARIKVDGKYKSVGSFSLLSDAVSAYQNARLEHYGEFA